MTSSLTRSTSLEKKLITGSFLLSVIFNLWGVSVGWKHINLPGCEFRQTQTAISALFIQRDHDFSLAYPTPVLGKPWSIPMEFPLYQWTVVVVSNATGIPLQEAARLVGVVCFFLCLPAVYLLLRRLALKETHGLIVISLILTCPLYIFYARAFLIETMALMLGFWYAIALIKTLENRTIGWLMLVNAAGIGVGLVKVTTFIIFLLPAFAWSISLLWESRPREGSPGWSVFFRTFGWLAAAHALPFLAAIEWVHFSDGVKALSPSGQYLESSNMIDWNFGVGRRFDPAIWSAIWHIISQEVARPVLLVAGGILTLVFGRRWWIHIAALLGIYGAVLLIFPVLFAGHSYYHVAAAFLLILALGFALISTFQSTRLPRFLPFILWGIILITQARTFLEFHYPLYRLPGNEGGLASALHEIVKPDEIIVIAGDDWSSILPYYAERRALMIPDRQDQNRDYIRATFAALKDESVVALVLFENQQHNQFIRELAAERFDINLQPGFTWKDRGRDVVVYLKRQIQIDALTAIQRVKGFNSVVLTNESKSFENVLANRVMEYSSLMPRHQNLFRIMSPRPVRFYSSFGPELWDEDKPGRERYAAHPDTKLWFQLTAGHHQLTTSLEILAGAYQGVPHPDASDGVELVATAVHRDGHCEILRHQYFDPRDNPAERGPQSISWSFDLPADSEFELSVNAGPKGNAARDWTGLSRIVIK